MPELLPFEGVHFNPDRVGGDLGPVLSPPYDVVGEEDARRLEAQHPYNCVRLELCIPPADPPPARYNEAAARWSSWRHEGILVRDPVPSLYVYRHSFLHGGCRLVRTALVGRLGGGVMPHEETMTAPREDRLHLLRACRAQFSPILALYEDPRGRVASQVEAVLSGRSPDLVAQLGGEELRVWRLDDRALVNSVVAALAPLRAVIADGHHRYESVGRFAWERTGRDGRAAVLAALVSTGDPGLVVLPTHRLVRSAGTAQRLIDAVSGVFGSAGEVAPMAAPAGDKRWPAKGAAFLESLAESGGSKTTLVAASRDRAWAISSDRDTAGVLELVDRVVDGVLGVEGAPGGSPVVEYTRDATSAVQEVLSGRAEIAFLVPSVSVDEVFRKACQGYRFPRKTTYFYPKVPAGLVMCDLELPRSTGHR
ncbi:MAG: DUF1015 domain-containing protein [Firmicutes bacterium]|nr:DUF1015 domain-containing protein [Bacillota bacterium]